MQRLGQFQEEAGLRIVPVRLGQQRVGDPPDPASTALGRFILFRPPRAIVPARGGFGP
jgi:hypothetical protein